MRKKNKQTTLSLMRLTGVTLIELMVVIAIVSILAMIAIPTYKYQIMTSKRDDGRAMLMQAAAKQELYYLDSGVYTADMTQLGYAANPAISPEEGYEVSATVANSGQTYLLTATRQTTQINDARCGDLTLNNLNVKSAINATETNPGAKCW